MPPVVEPEIAVGHDGNPIVCWSDYGRGNWEIYVRRWDGSAWVEIGKGSASGGGIGGNAGDSSDPRIAIDGKGRPLICWHDDTAGNDEVYVKTWDGSSWIEVGMDSASGGGISNDRRSSLHPDVAVGSDGNPVVCWTSGEVYVKRWDGSSWIEVGMGSASGGGISDNKEVSGSPVIAIDGCGDPVIAFWNGTSAGDHEIYVKKALVNHNPREASILEHAESSYSGHEQR